MATLTLTRPCYRCRTATSSRSGYCPNCEPKEATQRWKHHHQGKTTTERGYGSKWRRLRALVLAEANHICEVCGIRTAAEVDHIQAKAHGGTDARDNLRAICSRCHAIKTAADAAQGNK